MLTLNYNAQVVSHGRCNYTLWETLRPGAAVKFKTENLAKQIKQNACRETASPL